MLNLRPAVGWQDAHTGRASFDTDAIWTTRDGGDTWRAAGRVDGEPYKFKAIGGSELYLALSDGTIVHTTDGGESWKVVFSP